MSKLVGHDLISSGGDVKVFPKTSFDRFGDDLTELILNYLTFEDKFRFECLNRRIPNLIHTKTTHLCIDYQTLEGFVKKNITQKLPKEWLKQIIDYENFDYKLFETFVRKLKHINSLVIDGNHRDIAFRVIEIIADNCHHLRHFKAKGCLSLNEKSVEYFAQKCGKDLKILDIDLSNDSVKKLLKYTPDVWSVKTIEMNALMSVEKKSLPKLRQIGFDSHYLYTEQEIEAFESLLSAQITDFSIRVEFDIFDEPIYQSFVFKSISNFKKLTCLRLHLWGIDAIKSKIVFNILKDFFRSLSHLPKLDIKFSFGRKTHFFAEDRKYLKLIGDNCKQLRELTVDSDFNDISDDSDDSISGSNEDESEGDIDNPIDDLKGLNNLEKLTLRTDVYYPSLMNIELVLPQLKFLSIQKGLNNKPFVPIKYIEYLSQSKQFKLSVDKSCIDCVNNDNWLDRIGCSLM